MNKQEMLKESYLIQLGSLFFFLLGLYCLLTAEWGSFFGYLALGGLVFLLGKLVRIMAHRKNR
jgi:hypothetical protein